MEKPIINYLTHIWNKECKGKSIDDQPNILILSDLLYNAFQDELLVVYRERPVTVDDYYLAFKTLKVKSSINVEGWDYVVEKTCRLCGMPSSK